MYSNSDSFTSLPATVKSTGSLVWALSKETLQKREEYLVDPKKKGKQREACLRTLSTKKETEQKKAV